MCPTRSSGTANAARSSVPCGRSRDAQAVVRLGGCCYDRFAFAAPRRWLADSPDATAISLAGDGVVTGTRRACRAGLAVEPDEGGAVLAVMCPGAEVLDGRGEDIPLPDTSVDAVVISAAWHWLDPERAVPEITRVLRVGGSLGVIWISRDDRVPWVPSSTRWPASRARRPVLRRVHRAPPPRDHVPAGHADVAARGAAIRVLAADDLGATSWPARHLQRRDHARPGAAGRSLPAGQDLPRPPALGPGGRADDLPVPAQHAPAWLTS